MSTALIVDDSSENLYLLRCILAADGFDVVEAKNGREALARASEHDVDLVISDILMPVMDGFSLCHEWKTHPLWKSIPFVFYTATYVDKRDEELAMSLGADEFIVKPTDPRVLRQRVADVLSRQRQGALAKGSKPGNELAFLQQYNDVLIHKLEAKVLALEESNRALRIKDMALASSASGIVLTSVSGHVTYTNLAMLRLCGRPDSEIVGRPVEGLFKEPEALSGWKEGDVIDGQRELELEPAAPGASPVWAQVSGHVVTDNLGQRVGLMLSCVDVTERKRLQQEVVRSQRLEALSLFAAGVAHDFNNLLIPIFAALEQEGSQSTPSEYHEMAMAAFERARDLTRRLLTFSKGSVARRQAIDLRQLIEEAVSLALAGSGVHCEKRYSDQLLTADGDPGQLAQVLNNLLVNARQALREKGTIVVSTAVSERETQAVLPPGRYAVIRIADDGPGIPPGVLPRIFEPYFTTKDEGSGLGLATSQAIIHEHGGCITVSTRLGAGTTFEVMLPLANDKRVQAPAPVSMLIGASSGRILVMDDQVAIQALLKSGLERAGYAVVVVNNGEQAIVEFERARGQRRPFDLAILDITVRGGMGGPDTLAALRRMDPGVPVMAMTGYYEGTVDDLHARGFTHVLFKPFLIHEMLATMRAVLERESTPAQRA